MKDTIIKETGNSRFLRSALPAGTSWEDALAMLIAGTFPVDFAGINALGIDVLGTALNKLTFLSDETEIEIFGDASDRTPNQALLALFEFASKKAKIVTGIYTGNGVASRLIDLGFEPKAVFVTDNYGSPSDWGATYAHYYGGLAVLGSPAVVPNLGNNLSIEATGFRVYYNAPTYSAWAISNASNVVYHYIAIA